MNDNIDSRTGYIVPDGYFQDFALRMSTMVADKHIANRRNKMRVLFISAISSVAAMIVVLIGILHYSKFEDPISKMKNLSSDELFIGDFGITESDIVYYYLNGDENNGISSNEDILEYISNVGNINVFALLDN